MKQYHIEITMIPNEDGTYPCATQPHGVKGCYALLSYMKDMLAEKGWDNGDHAQVRMLSYMDEEE